MADGESEVTTGPAAPLPREIGNLFDASWLLEYRLAGGADEMAGGRRGYRVGVAFDWPWGRLFFPSNVVVDAKLRILLRCISYADSRSGAQPVMRYELRDVVTGPCEPADFRPDIPAGMPVVEEPDHDPRQPVNLVGVVARQAAKEARSAVRNLLGTYAARTLGYCIHVPIRDTRWWCSAARYGGPSNVGVLFQQGSRPPVGITRAG